jgi:hypothetical protein
MIKSNPSFSNKETSEKVNILFLILAKNEEIWERDRAFQEQTWARESAGRKIRFLYGSDNFQVKSENSIYVDCPDEYRFILRKSILGMRHVVNTLAFDFIVRTNVSTFFDVDKLLAKLEETSSDLPIALGFFEQHKKEYSLEIPNRLFISGSAIIMNRKAAEVLGGMDWRVYKSIPDDVAITHHLWSKKVKLMHLSRSNYHITHTPLPAPIYRLKSSEFSMLTGERMKLLDRLKQSNKPLAKIFTIFKLLRLEISTCTQNNSLIRDFITKPSLHAKSRLRCVIALKQLRIERA